ncbi:DUF4365 domain-containing protein [uncultured Brevundimonas sp.]|uniref:DUF4365 domain-containing protein n=1 Tax=uncultured Brevundimonas sp. TaxID=213418 RepID=UPI0025EA0289|nr:DUF4365 domain-containing protein [uncultured Brevundimonas sp.]
MKLPTRSVQQGAEARSLAIVRYKLEPLGIFRDQRDNDFGIDVDFEWAPKNQVSGRFVKIQVKSSEQLSYRKDGSPSVGGVKQTTLAYWCRIAWRTSVMAIAVDLKTEQIYATLDLFWQATQKIDGGDSSKSISFLPAGKDDVEMAKALLARHVGQPSASELVSAHTTALRRLREFLELLTDAYHYDAGTPIDVALFQDLIDVCRVLLWAHAADLFETPADKQGWNSAQYWIEKSETDNWDGLVCYAAQHPLSLLLPALAKELARLRNRVLTGKYFWSHDNPSYLELVYERTIPEATDREALINWSHHFDQRNTVVSGSGAWFVHQAQTPAAPKPKRVRTSPSRP